MFQAWEEFAKGKRKKTDVSMFERSLEDNIFDLHKELEDKTYRHGNYQEFYVRDPKIRHIHKACVKDRVVHHLTSKILEQIFDELRKYKKEKGTTSVPEGCLVPNTPEWRAKYEQLVSSATKWPEALNILEINDDPNTTPSDRIKSVIGGYKSRETDLSNKLNDKQTEIDKANQEIENRIEQISRLEKTLLDKEKYYKSQMNALNKQIKNGSSALPLAQARIGVLEGELDEANKAKGRALIGVQEYKGKFENCQKDKSSLDPTLQFILSLSLQYVGNIIRRKGGDQYE